MYAGRQAAVQILAHRRCGHGNNGYVSTDNLFPADLGGGLQAGSSRVFEHP